MAASQDSGGCIDDRLSDAPPADDDELAGLLRLTLAAALAGLGVGLVGGLFRGALAHAELLRVLVGMAAFFAATVRAPITGVVLISEMAATHNLVLPMITASAGAILVAATLGSAPIYETLRLRMMRDQSR